MDHTVKSSSYIHLADGMKWKKIGMLAVMGIVLPLSVSVMAGYAILAANRPIIAVVNEPVHNYGSVVEGTLVIHDFVIQNVGRKILEIKRVMAGCGCTHASARRQHLAAGDQTEIHVVFDSGASQSGTIEVVVETNDSKQRYVKLALYGKVVNQLAWFPRSLAFGGKIADVLGTVKTIRLTEAIPQGVAVQEVTCSSKRISAAFTEAVNGPECYVKLSDCSAGVWADTVTIRYVAKGVNKIVQIPVHINVDD